MNLQLQRQIQYTPKFKIYDTSLLEYIYQRYQIGGIEIGQLRSLKNELESLFKELDVDPSLSNSNKTKLVTVESEQEISSYIAIESQESIGE